MKDFQTWLTGFAVGLFIAGLVWMGVNNNDECAHKFGVRTQEYALCKFQNAYPVKP